MNNKMFKLKCENRYEVRLIEKDGWFVKIREYDFHHSILGEEDSILLAAYLADPVYDAWIVAPESMCLDEPGGLGGRVHGPFYADRLSPERYLSVSPDTLQAHVDAFLAPLWPHGLSPDAPGCVLLRRVLGEARTYGATAYWLAADLWDRSLRCDYAVHSAFQEALLIDRVRGTLTMVVLMYE